MCHSNVVSPEEETDDNPASLGDSGHHDKSARGLVDEDKVIVVSEGAEQEI